MTQMSLIILPHGFVAKWSIGVYHDYFTSTITMIHKATRIEASSGKLVKPPWSKELTAADVADLKAGIGEATKILGSLPRCIPSVVVTLFRQLETLGTLGAFCNRGVFTGPISFHVNKTKGCFLPQDIAKVGAALRSPVDR